MRWGLFLGACALAWYLLLRNGAPLAAVVTGTLLIAAWNVWKFRRSSDQGG